MTDFNKLLLKLKVFKIYDRYEILWISNTLKPINNGETEVALCKTVWMKSRVY